MFITVLGFPPGLSSFHGIRRIGIMKLRLHFSDSIMTHGMANNGDVLGECPGVNVLDNKWSYPAELRYNLETSGLSDKIIDETLACAWEYSRCVIPEWTNWNRYLAFNRTIIIAVIAEFRGDLLGAYPSRKIACLEKLRII